MTPFVQDSTVNNIVSYQNRYHMIDSQNRSIISNVFSTHAKSPNVKNFDRKYHCLCVCCKDLLSFLQKRARSMWLISKDINAPLPSSVIPFHITGIHATSKLCRGSTDPCKAEPLSHCISIKTSFVSLPPSVTLEAVPPGSHCNSYNELLSVNYICTY